MVPGKAPTIPYRSEPVKPHDAIHWGFFPGNGETEFIPASPIFSRSVPLCQLTSERDSKLKVRLPDVVGKKFLIAVPFRPTPLSGQGREHRAMVQDHLCANMHGLMIVGCWEAWQRVSVSGGLSEPGFSGLGWFLNFP